MTDRSCPDCVVTCVGMTENTANGRDADATVDTFRIEVPQAQLDDLHMRLDLTRWPDGDMRIMEFSPYALLSVRLERA